MKAASREIHPVVSIVNNQTTTTSMNLASYFEKQHKDVLKAIQNLECSDDFRRRNFAPTNYLDSQGRQQPACEMTRDGYTMLAFGFTGPKAARFRENYIDAFNKMEDALRRIQTETLIAETKREALNYFRKGAALTALLQRRDTLDKVEQFYWFRVHGQLTHYEAAHVCNLGMPEADEIARSLREIGLFLPVIQGQCRKKEMSRFFSDAVGGFLPEDLRTALADLRKEVSHA